MLEAVGKKIKANNKHYLRVKERVDLIANEIKESEEPQEEEQE